MVNRFGIIAAAALLSSAAPSLAAINFAAANEGLKNLQTYNLFVTGNLTSNNHVDGKTFVGGDLNLSGNFESNSKGVSQPIGKTDQPAAVTVVGSVTSSQSGYALKINNGGGLDVGGNVSRNVSLQPNGANQQMDIGGTSPAVQNLNGNKLNTNVAGLSAALVGQRSDIISNLTSLSAALSDLKTTSNVQFTNGNSIASFEATGSGVTVYSLNSLADLGTKSIRLNDTAGALMVINVLSGGAEMFKGNFVSAEGSSSKTIWNFVSATGIGATTQTYGSILALNANATTQHNITGATVFKNFDQKAEVHQNFASTYQFSLGNNGRVPEPEVWVQMVLGFGLLGVALRSRRRWMPSVA